MIDHDTKPTITAAEAGGLAHFAAALDRVADAIDEITASVDAAATPDERAAAGRRGAAMVAAVVARLDQALGAMTAEELGIAAPIAHRLGDELQRIVNDAIGAMPVAGNA